jgi:hypothetical protein
MLRMKHRSHTQHTHTPALLVSMLLQQKDAHTWVRTHLGPIPSHRMHSTARCLSKTESDARSASRGGCVCCNTTTEQSSGPLLQLHARGAAASAAVAAAASNSSKYATATTATPRERQSQHTTHNALPPHGLAAAAAATKRIQPLESTRKHRCTASQTLPGSTDRALNRQISSANEPRQTPPITAQPQGLAAPRGRLLNPGHTITQQRPLPGPTHSLHGRTDRRP